MNDSMDNASTYSERAKVKKLRVMLVGGWLMSPLCFFLLAYANSLMWVVCPQALVVMFLRQSQHGYDSLGAPDIPDLLVALFYYPVIGRILVRASKMGKFRQVAIRVVLWHIVAFGLAIFTAHMRNRIWRMGFGAG